MAQQQQRKKSVRQGDSSDSNGKEPDRSDVNDHSGCHTDSLPDKDGKKQNLPGTNGEDEVNAPSKKLLNDKDEQKPSSHASNTSPSDGGDESVGNEDDFYSPPSSPTGSPSLIPHEQHSPETSHNNRQSAATQANEMAQVCIYVKELNVHV